ncbi:MAG: TonB-dependent receptor [Psychroflexus sp.]|nr:TonB-dependent receptor [Psychroflexus sp.]MDR9448688.1 TonB-dependent receptor [Psychroflexus sp.]
MKKRRLLFILIYLLSLPLIYAQDNDQKDKENCSLEIIQHKIKNDVKEDLKVEIKQINKALDEEKITKSEAEEQKKEVAEQKAKNLEERQEIARLFYQYAQRNDIDNVCKVELPVTKACYEDWVSHCCGSEDEEINFNFGWPELNKQGLRNSKMYSRMIVGFGFNNTFNENDFLGESNYDTYPSRYFEIGWEWSHRILNEANWLRFNYGFSFQFNGFKQDDNQIFVENDEQTELQDFNQDLEKSKLRMTNLIFPLHLELSNSQKVIKDDGNITFRDPGFKFGFGGFAGLNLSNMQKLKYEDNGNDFKVKEKGDFNAERFLYGLSTYIGFDDIQLFGQYNLNSVFTDNPIDEHNFQLGIRVEIGE